MFSYWNYAFTSTPVLLTYVPVPNSGKPHLLCLLLHLGCQVLFEEVSPTNTRSLVSAELSGLLGSLSHFSNNWRPAMFSTASPPGQFQSFSTSTTFTFYLWPDFLHLLRKLRSIWNSLSPMLQTYQNLSWVLFFTHSPSFSSLEE